jgi:cytidylate kinase
MIAAEDAVLLDTSALSIEEAVAAAVAAVEARVRDGGATC